MKVLGQWLEFPRSGDDMALSLPNFNLHCNIWHGAITWYGAYPAAVPVAAPSLSPVCQLFIDSHVIQGTWQSVASAAGLIYPLSSNAMPIILRLPKLTDIRPMWFLPTNARVTDGVEVPAGSKRYYAVTQVEDMHKGFPNEYRVALLAWVYYYGSWPLP